MTSEQALQLQRFHIGMRSWRDSQRLLRRFREINETYFKGRLPSVRVGYCPAMLCSRELNCANGWVVRKKKFGGRKYWVCLHPRMKRKAGTQDELNTLIHEAIHVFLLERGPHNAHGRDFQAIFERLFYRQGAFDPAYAIRAYARYGWKKPAKFSVFENKWHRTYSSPLTTTSATTTS
jgi:hypothetical protein